MKKIIRFLIPLLIFCLIVSVSCMNKNTEKSTLPTMEQTTISPQTEEHIHSFGAWTVVIEPTCIEKGKKERICTCGERETQELDLIDHVVVEDSRVNPTCVEEGKSEGSHCFVCNKVLVEQKALPVVPHKWVSGNCQAPKTCSVCKQTQGEPTAHKYVLGSCSTCGALEPSEGLIYELNSNGDGYIVKGIGTCSDYKVVIADTYEGKPVIEICDKAFSSCNTINKIVLTANIKVIGEHAFDGCNNITDVTIPEGVERIGSYAFSWCVGINKIDIPKTVVSIGEGAFSYCLGISSLNLNDGIENLGKEAFCHCSKLTSVTLPSSVKAIGDNCFSYCGNLKNRSRTESR